MINGLPRDVRAQIGRDLTAVERKGISGLARRKAIGIFMLDVALFYVGNTLLQNGLQLLRGDEGLDDIGRNYAERLSKLMDRAKEHPLETMWPLSDLDALSATTTNEPGKEARVLLGHQPDGTAIYGRIPTGKIGEEFAGWLTQPLYMLKNKEGTLARPIFNTLANDRGFGQKVYNRDYVGLKGAVQNVGNIAWEFLRSEIPEMQVRAVQQIVSGSDKTWLPWAQLVSPFFGFTVSRGAPGGEAVGELYAARTQQADRIREALSAIRDLFQQDRRDEAVSRMRALGM